ncbi:MAG: bifunctional hydroxymethylpyrimidine kinase/phosphomethylpyrimidine kinase [Chloroflexi bacterium]|nr:bifunctional hydroxymethylpyrimidine kinase/phosphomethylpyrimidine kinase [Chloroflexota bacterium]
MTIAGSDSGGGAGVQADLKAFAAFGVYGTSAITAVTAQNTQGVTAVHEVPIDVIAAQIDAIVSDIGADAVKTGMLASVPVIETVVARLAEHRLTQLVVDPVMVAKSGDQLLRVDAVETLRRQLLPLALVVTPNLPEAEVLADRPARTDAEIRDVARAIHALGPRYVVVKGGHRDAAEAVDLLFDGERFQEFRAERVPTVHTHGTGCTFAASIAANLARGRAVPEAVGAAKEYLTAAIRAAYVVGRGRSPVHHFHRLWGSFPQQQRKE